MHGYRYHERCHLYEEEMCLHEGEIYLYDGKIYLYEGEIYLYEGQMRSSVSLCSAPGLGFASVAICAARLHHCKQTLDDCLCNNQCSSLKLATATEFLMRTLVEPQDHRTPTYFRRNWRCRAIQRIIPTHGLTYMNLFIRDVDVSLTLEPCRGVLSLTFKYLSSGFEAY